MNGKHLTGGMRQQVRRHRLMAIFGLAILCASPPVLVAHDANEVYGSEKNLEEPKLIPSQSTNMADSESPTNPVDAKIKTSNLKVVVSGGTKEIQQADLLVTPVQQSGEKKPPEIKGFTDKNGQHVFSALPVGTVEVRVIAKIWKTKKQQIALKAGENELTIELESQ